MTDVARSSEQQQQGGRAERDRAAEMLSEVGFLTMASMNPDTSSMNLFLQLSYQSCSSASPCEPVLGFEHAA